MRYFLVLLTMLTAAPAAFAFKADVSANTTSVYAWDKFELAVNGDFGATNCYDYNLVSVRAYFKNPAGVIREADGFYMQDFEYSAADNSYTPGQGVFKVRFAFNRSGPWLYSVRIFMKNRQVFESAWKKINVLKPAGQKGFIRVSPSDPLFLEYDNKEPFFGIGANVCWWRDKGLPDYEAWLSKYAENGVNLVRLWMAPWSFGIEWDCPIGNYGNRQKQAFMLDRVMQMASEKGMAVQLCLVPHGELSARVNPEWEKNPYNSANTDGLIASPKEFFTDPVVKKAYKNRLRYIIARWGFSAGLLAWELFNEVDLTDDYDPAAVTAWHKEMAAFIRKTDPFRHLITTSFSSKFREDSVWRLEDIDYTQTHSYDMRDEAGEIYERSASRIEDFPKPHVFGEFGPDAGNEKLKQGIDRDGVCLHNSIWSGAFTLSFGTPMPWYWDLYIDDFNLYDQFGPLADFVRGIKWPQEDLTGIKNRQVFFKSAEGRKGGDVIFYANNAWEKAKKSIFKIMPDGSMVNEEFLPAYLFGSQKEEMRNDPVIAFRNELPVQLIVRVGKVSDDNTLVFSLNGQKVNSVPLNASDMPDKKYFEEWKIYQAGVGRDYVLEVPPGDNEISLSNAGKDWILIESVKVTDFLNARLAPVFVSGVQGPSCAYLWLKSADYGWSLGKGSPVNGAYLDVKGLKPGRYVVMYYETHTGSVIKEREDIIDKDMDLRLELPEFSKDIAVKIRKYKK